MLAFITWTVDPALVEFAGREIRWYGLLFAVGYLIGYELERRIFKREGAPDLWIDKLFIYSIVATVVGARLGHCLFYEPAFYLANPIEILKVWNGGLASHGGTIALVIAVILFARKYTKISALWTFDRFVIPIAFVGACIRIGNLMNHEIYGHATGSSWGFRFISNIGAWKMGADPIFTVPVHPTAIYEALCYLVTFVILLYLYYKTEAPNRPGLIFGLFLIGIFASRFFIEFVKENQEAFEDTMLFNMGQLLSIPFVLAGVYFLVRALIKPKVEWKIMKH